MARAKRSDVFDPDVVGVYHCFNRIVRRSFLCGYDRHTKKDYSYRRDWFYERLKYFASYFAIDVLAYAILSDHYHLVLRNRPDQVAAMDDREVVTAWLWICAKSQKREEATVEPPSEPEIQYELNQPGRVAELRGRLSNPSWLIRQLAQYMGIRCNSEDGVTGHFWEARFGMTRLLDDAAVLACLAYVDLNPIRAHLANSLEGYEHVSIGERLRTLENEKIDPSSWLAPIALESETDGQPAMVVNRLSREELKKMLGEKTARPLGCLPIGLNQYADLLRWLAKSECNTDEAGAKALWSQGEGLLNQFELDPKEFSDLVHHFGKRFFTAAGCPQSLAREASRRGKRRLKGPGRCALSRRPPKAAVP